MPISKIERPGMPTGAVLQVISVTKTDTFASTSSAFVDISGLSATITPISATSKILVVANIAGGCQYRKSYIRLVRNGTAICLGDAAGTRQRVSTGNLYSGDVYRLSAVPLEYLDSPSTTSAVTYSIQTQTYDSAYSVRVNHTVNDADDGIDGRGTSTITLMEISA